MHPDNKLFKIGDRVILKEPFCEDVKYLNCIGTVIGSRSSYGDGFVDVRMEDNTVIGGSYAWRWDLYKEPPKNTLVDPKKPVALFDQYGRQFDARVICTDRKESSLGYSLCVLYKDSKGDEHPHWCKPDGHRSNIEMTVVKNIPTKREGWVILYPYNTQDSYNKQISPKVYSSKEEAINTVIKTGNWKRNYITTKIEWEE